MCFRVFPLGFKALPPGFRVFPLGFRVLPLGFGVFPLGFRVFPPGFRVLPRPGGLDEFRIAPPMGGTGDVARYLSIDRRLMSP